MKFCYASNAAIKNIKIARKKINFFFQNIFNKIAILKNEIVYFQILGVLPVIFTAYLLSNNKAMNQLFPTSC